MWTLATLILAAVTSAAGSLPIQDKKLNVNGVLEVPSDVTEISESVTVIFSTKGLLKLGPGQKLHIRGKVVAPLTQQIFDLAPGAKVLGFTSDKVSPRWWGARADGKTNDTQAFQKLAEYVSDKGGGHVHIPAGTYIVGEQVRDSSSHKMQSRPILSFNNLKMPLTIDGESSKTTRLKLESGLKFGSFHPKTGAVFKPKGRFLDSKFAADVGAMIDVFGSTDLTIRNLELDGNLTSLKLGGTFGDKGRQLPAYGIRIYNNKRVKIENVYTHHHALDGIVLGFTGLHENSPSYPHVIDNVVSEYNARQGISIVGGTDVHIRNSKFNHTGRQSFFSSPGAGIDIEAEKSVNRKIVIENVEVINNVGVGIVADSGDSRDISIRKTRVVGTTNFSLWLRKPKVRLEDSHITGSAVNFYAQGDDAFTSKNTVFDDLDYIDENGKNLGAHRTNTLIDLYGNGGDIVLDGLTAIGTRVKPLIMDKGTLKNSKIILRKSDTAPGEPVIFVRETRLENVTFSFEPASEVQPLAKSWYIASGSCDDGGSGIRKHVRVNGKIGRHDFLSWCRPNGPTGDVFK